MIDKILLSSLECGSPRAGRPLLGPTFHRDERLVGEKEDCSQTKAHAFARVPPKTAGNGSSGVRKLLGITKKRRAKRGIAQRDNHTFLFTTKIKTPF